MKKYDSSFGFLITSKQKNIIKKRAKKLDISIAEYLRSLAKIDVNFDDIEKYNQMTKERLKEIENIKARMGDLK